MALIKLVVAHKQKRDAERLVMEANKVFLQSLENLEESSMRLRNILDEISREAACN